MNVDEVIAGNVRKIREERGWSVSNLAQVLGVGRHIVYDYERPRVGQEQRVFTWGDIVRLCFALQVTIYELVLPDEDVILDDVYPGGEKRRQVAATAAAEGHELAEALDKDSRDLLGRILFGVKGSKLNAEWIDGLAIRGQRDQKRLADIIQRAVAEEVWKRLEDE